MTLKLTLAFIAGMAVVIAIGTWLIGWPAVPVVALIVGVRGRRHPGIPLLAALASLLGWTALLVLAASRGPVMDLATRLGGVMQVPWPVVIAATLLFPALLGWSAARVARGITTLPASRRARAG